MTMSVAEKQSLLDEIAAEIRSCTLCPLHKTRTNAVPGEGPADAKIMFIGEAPGREEDIQGRPFVGPAGRYLNQLLALAGLSREQVFITNIVKCRPPGNREPRSEEAAACRPYLDGQIATICPRVICLLGRPATMALLDPSATMSRIHGQTFERDGIVYIPLYHPAAALHNQRLGPVLNDDFKRLASFFERVLEDS